jgi:plastocyanin
MAVSRWAGVWGMLAGALIAGGCGAAVAGSTGGSEAPSAVTQFVAAGAAGGGTISVVERDFSITISGGTSLTAGTYTVSVSNQGPSSHNLTITGPGVHAATPTFAPGGSHTLTVSLQPGTYQFFCSVPGHAAAGMLDIVTVHAATSPGGGTTPKTGGAGPSPAGSNFGANFGG